MQDSIEFHPPRRRFRRTLGVIGCLAVAAGATTLAVSGSSATASGADPVRPIAVNQTDGYGDGQVVVFGYGQQYQCVTGPFDDRDYDGAKAAVDPDEFQTPHCVVGSDGKVGLDPAGKDATKTEPLYVIVPFFDGDHDGQAAGGLAPTLQSLFGQVPDAFDPTPGEPVQCPEPGGNLTQHKGAFSTCTMHPTQLDLGSVLGDLGLIPKQTVVNLPLVNHSHIIDGKNFGSIWWRLNVVLVTDPAAWPDVDGTKGITSVDSMNAAVKAGKAIGPTPSNFFLFFDSRQLHSH